MSSQCPAQCLAYVTVYIPMSQRMRQVTRAPGTGVTGPLQLPSSCPAPSPLEVGQLLLQQEHVGFELIPLLKDLLKLLSTEAALPCVGGTLFLLRGIRLRKGRLDRGVPWLAPLCPLGHHGNSEGMPGRETAEARGHHNNDSPVTEAGWGVILVCHLPTSCWTCWAAQRTSQVPTLVRIGKSP